MNLNRKEFILLLLVLLLGIRLRVYKIDSPIADWHSWRQADTASVSRNYLMRGIDLLHPRFDDISDIPSGRNNPEGYRFVEFPLANAIHAIAARALPGTNFVTLGRSLSVVYSGLTILLLFFLVRLHADSATGLLASTVLSLMPFHIYYSRVILPEPFIIMVSLIFLLSFSFWVKSKSVLFLAISIVSFALLILLKPYMAIFFIPAATFYLVANSLTKIHLKKLTYYFFIGIIPFVIWFIWARLFPEGIPHFKWAFNGDNIRFRPAFFYWIFGIRFGTLILGVWGVFLFGLGLFRSIETKKYFFPAWAVSILVYVSILATGNVRHDYYQAVTTPMFASVVGLGLIYLIRQSLTSLFLGVFALFLMFLISFWNIRGYYQVNHPEILIAGQAADRILPKEAKVIAPYNGDTAFLYQINRPGWPHVTLPINELIDQGATHYVSVNFDTQTNDFMSRFQILEQTDQYVILNLTVSPQP